MKSAESVKRTAELLLPGSVVGVVALVAVGGVALFGGLPADYALVAGLALGVPLGLSGAGYNYLLARGRIRLGGIAPCVAYWLVAFTASRLVHESVLDLFAGRAVAFPEGLLSFVVFQMMVSVGFAVGFVWLHEHAAPLWWVKIRDRNEVAATYVSLYMQQAVKTQQRKDQEKKRKQEQRDATGGQAPMRPFLKKIKPTSGQSS